MNDNTLTADGTAGGMAEHITGDPTGRKLTSGPSPIVAFLFVIGAVLLLGAMGYTLRGVRI